jgi:hypothetical protein
MIVSFEPSPKRYLVTVRHQCGLRGRYGKLTILDHKHPSGSTSVGARFYEDPGMDSVSSDWFRHRAGELSYDVYLLPLWLLKIRGAIKAEREMETNRLWIRTTTSTRPL